MSIKAMAQCWGADFPVKSELPISPTVVRLVALAIADVVNDLQGNEFYGSVTNLANKVGASRETVGLVIKHLVVVGVLERLDEHRGRKGTFRYLWRPLSDIPSKVDPYPPTESDSTIVGTIRQPLSEPSVTIPRERNSNPRTTSGQTEPLPIFEIEILKQWRTQ